MLEAGFRDNCSQEIWELHYDLRLRPHAREYAAFARETGHSAGDECGRDGFEWKKQADKRWQNNERKNKLARSSGYCVSLPFFQLARSLAPILSVPSRAATARGNPVRPIKIPRAPEGEETHSYSPTLRDFVLGTRLAAWLNGRERYFHSRPNDRQKAPRRRR